MQAEQMPPPREARARTLLARAQPALQALRAPAITRRGVTSLGELSPKTIRRPGARERLGALRQPAALQDVEAGEAGDAEGRRE